MTRLSRRASRLIRDRMAVYSAASTAEKLLTENLDRLELEDGSQLITESDS